MIRIASRVLAVALIIAAGAVYRGGRRETPAAEPTGEVLAFAQYDLDGDGQLDLGVITAQFASERDRVAVYDRDGDMRASTSWQEALDFDGDLWAFDAGADGAVELVVAFRREATRVVAELYDDRDGDGAVSVVQRGASLLISETPHWTLRLEAERDWWRADGELNMQLTALIDGHLPGEVEKGLYPSFLLDRLTTDGVPDTEWEIVDRGDDGIPDYYVSRLLADWPPERYRLTRFYLQVNAGAHRPSAPTRYAFWPLLGGTYEDGNFFDAPPHIGIDWWRGRIRSAGITGYPIEAGYYINSHQPVARGMQTAADFENPMAYYDLAADHDGRPELHVRMEYALPSNRIAGNLPLDQPLQMVRYSWDQDNDDNWDYKLDLLGRQSLGGQVSFADFRVDTVPYAELPAWVAARSWDAATFVAAEIPYYSTSEGIYEWSTAPLRDAYVSGQEPADEPLPAYLWLPPGLRGEHSAWLQGPARLSLSAIDHRLHLEGASHGLWNLGNGVVVRYASLGGRTVNRWTVSEDDLVTRSLYLAAGQLIYADGGGVQLLQLSVDPLVLTTAPPATHSEWAQLGALVERHRAAFAGDDLHAMLRQFDAPIIALPRAALRNFRPHGDGFRFELRLPPGRAPADVPWLEGMTSGAYLVSYSSDRGYRAEPLTPAVLEVAAPAVVSGSPVELHTQQLAATIVNHGLESAPEVPVDFVATRAGEPPQRVATVVLTIFGDDQATARAAWAPAAPGAWTVRATALDRGSDPLHLDIGALPVAPVDTLLAPASAPGTVMRLVPALIPLAALLALWLALRAAVPSARPN